jgi:Predicted membrane protein
MTKEEFLALAESRYEELESLKKHDNFYDYEKEFDRLWQEFGRSCLEQQLNEASKTKDRRKKKL